MAALGGIRIVTAVSEATRRTVLEMAGPLVQVDLLPNVLDEAAFAAPTREPRIRGLILFVGIVRRIKGLDVLVRALAILLADQPKAHLKVIGSTLTRSGRRDEQEVRNLATSLGVADRIEFVDHLTPHEVSAEMRRAAVLAVPSHRESFSAVTIEALASGTPVVATRCGGPEELLDNLVGRLVPVNDPPAMAAALAEILQSPQLFDPLTLRARVLPRYGFAATTERLGELYQSVLADGR
jgi:teichuronic acid biosynthesis glycosyltransferase TuaC